MTFYYKFHGEIRLAEQFYYVTRKPKNEHLLKNSGLKKCTETENVLVEKTTFADSECGTTARRHRQSSSNRTVASDFRKSPVDNRSFACESPKSGGQPATSVDILSQLNLNPNLLTQLTAAISRPIGVASPMLEEMKINFGSVPKIEQMDCSGGSFETVGSGSFDMMSAHSSFDHGNTNYNQATAEILATMPPKSVIQDDIRTGQGRFSLVRKRGRSEVWNLFGQVRDYSVSWWCGIVRS
ncbi:hypothetical protein CRE_13830 [Caenorhabditis remanei]|uniref:Uncharacterized protein n=1 Tax=Caenorhabditis remanei TaxID=31234 RepID=E3NRW7_CAERE|nr:hypothetical protein CRE_13830 [Caenorhabditis remanei]